MPSQALERWRHERADRLDTLIEAHSRVGGAGPGRRTRADELINRQINAALVLQLAAEFQGFARDLHDELAIAVRGEVSAFGAGVSTIVSLALNQPRQLDRGNATPGALGSDFARFGIDLWSDMKDRDARSPIRQAEPERLIRARNGLAHSDERQLQRLRAEGVGITLAAARGWRHVLDQLAPSMDAVLVAYFEARFGSRPRKGVRW